MNRIGAIYPIFYIRINQFINPSSFKTNCIVALQEVMIVVILES